MNQAREGVAIFGPDGERRFASEGIEWWVGQPLVLEGTAPFADALPQALIRAGAAPLPGVRNGYRSPRGEFLATLVHMGDVAVVHLRPMERRDPRAMHGKFLSVASHDLRGTLANVRSYASLLRGPRFGLEEKTLRAVDVIARNADRALALAEDLFDTLKADCGSLRVERSPEPLQPLLDRAVALCQPAAQEKGLTLALEGEGSVPQVDVDADRFTRACANLLAHAIWRSPEGGRAGLDVSREEGRLRVSAWDEGALATAEERSQAFERDARVAQERSLSGGFRLCLAAALARALDGDVGAGVDRHGRQNFFFTLPLPSSEQPST